MINREWRKANLLTFDDSIDDYGIPNQGLPQSKEIEITFRLYEHTKVDDIRFNRCTHAALTKEKEIKDSNKLEVDGITYSIEFVNAEGRLTQLLLVKDG